MKKLIVLLIITLSLIYCSQSWAQRQTRGYIKQDGTYVQPHYSTNPNNTRSDNWSTQGNVNPYTGQPGYRDPYQGSPNQLTPYQHRPRPATPGVLD